VHIYEGPTDEGTEISKATASGTEGAWTSGTANPALATGEHTYTAVATQTSPLGNPEGKSNTVTFTVNTEPPKVELSKSSVAERIQRQETDLQRDGEREHRSRGATYTKDRRRAELEVAKVGTAATGGAWSSGPVTPRTRSTGKHPTQPSRPRSRRSKREGKSKAVTFIVNDEPPTVTLNEVAKLSKNRQPVFAGYSNVSTEIVIHVYEGESANRDRSRESDSQRRLRRLDRREPCRRNC